MKKNIVYNQIAGQSVHRIEGLSDGVFAIATTLLVLEIKVPIANIAKTELDLFNALINESPRFIIYIMSFLTLGVFWTGQSAQYNFITKYDRNLNWMALFYLLFVALLPFTTEFLGEHYMFRLAIGLYWINISLLGLILYIHWDYAVRKGYLSLSQEDKAIITFVVRRRIITVMTLYALSALLCFIDTRLSIWLIFMIQLNSAVALIGRGRPYHIRSDESRNGS